MPRLSQEQYNTLKARGLDDNKIAQLAEQKGYDLPDNRDFLQKTGDIVNAIFPGKQVGESIGTLAGLGISKLQGTSKFYDTSSPSPLQVTGDIVAGAATVGGLKTPVAASATGRILQSGGIGAAISGGSSLAKGDNLLTVGKETAKGGILGGTIQSVFEAIPLVTKLVSNKSESLSKGLREKNLRLTPLQKEKLNSKVGDVVEYLSKNKVKGNPEQQYKFIVDSFDDMEKQVQTLIKNSGKQYSKQEVIDLINNIPNVYATEFDNPEVYDQLISKSEKFANYINKNFKTDISATKLNQFKRAYMKNAYNKTGDAVANQASEAIGNTLYAKLLKDVKELQSVNKEYSTIIVGKKILGKALGRNELGLIGNLVSSTAGAITGGAVGGPVGSAIGLIIGPKVGKLVGGTAARTKYAQALEAIKKIADKSSGNPNITIPRSLLLTLFNSD